MLRSFLVRVTMKLVSGFAAGALLVGVGAGCAPSSEKCWEIKACGSKTLSACTNYESGCRYKSNDGHSWSCTGSKSGNGETLNCDVPICETAAQEAADWCFSQSAATTPTAAGQLVVTELMYDPDVVGDDAGEWFEIYNRGGSVYDLFGCEIRDRDSSHTIAAHLLIPSEMFRTAANFATGGGFAPDYTYSGITFDNNAADEVSIWCGSTLIDRFAYSPTQASASGHALSVDADHYNATDNDRPDYFCPATSPYNTDSTGSISDYGTPGAPNPRCR
jgi:hypothetical protein